MFAVRLFLESWESMFIFPKRNMINWKSSNKLMLFKICCFVKRTSRSCCWHLPSACGLVFVEWTALKPADLVPISPLNLKRDVANARRGAKEEQEVKDCQEYPEDTVVTLNRAKGTRSMDPASPLWFGEGSQNSGFLSSMVYSWVSFMWVCMPSPEKHGSIAIRSWE